MSGYFYCQHCGRKTQRNPRLKNQQKYCGRKSCQQSRKNKWERERLKKILLTASGATIRNPAGEKNILPISI